MSTKVVFAGIAITVVAIGGFLLLSSDNTSDSADTQNTQPSAPAETAQPTSDTGATDQLLKLEEVAAHNTEDDCWTIVDGTVYDITSYVPRHPGGDEILLACGTDGTSLFTMRTTESGDTVGSGTPHSASATNQLASFKIGILDSTAE